MNFLFFLSFLQVQLAACADEDSFALTADIPYKNEVGSKVLLYQKTFANSWDAPASEQYTPDIQDFDRVVLELQVNTTGANYDRLGQIFLDDIEIWRTSTGEPDTHGTTWTTFKDVSHYSNLFRSVRAVNLVIENLITDQLSGVFYATLTAHFYKDSDSQGVFDDSWLIDLNHPPNEIRSLSKPGSKAGDSWSAPGDDISVTIDPLERSVNRAVIHVFASGNANDEFWWDTNHSSDMGPSRFVDLFVNERLAGFASPYPVIFTGGVNPYLWKPMVDVRAFDLPAYFIDITPYLPELWENPSTLKINVTTVIDRSQVPSNWIINYNLLTWSIDGQTNSGTMDTPDINDDVTSGGGAASVSLNRELRTSAQLTINGEQKPVKWEQSVNFNNTAANVDSFSHVWQNTQGSASVSGVGEYTTEFEYPLQCDMRNDNNFFRIQQSYDVEANGLSYMQWIDTSVSLDDQGKFSSSSSREYVGMPGGANHFAESSNLQLVQRW